METYSTDSSDSDSSMPSKVLDFSYLMLDTQTVGHNLNYAADEESSVHVESLLLYHNQMTAFPEEVLRFQNLRILDVSANNISRIPECILGCTNLVSLIARSNNLDDDAFPKSFGQLSNLRELNFSGNNLSIIPPQVYELVNLRYLYVGSNRIVEISKDIGRMNRLQVLYLGGNQLSCVPVEIGQLTQLRALVLCENNLESLPSTVANLIELKSLLIHKNKLTTLPPEIVTLQKLMELSLRDNPLVVRFVKDMLHDPPTLLELAARTVKSRNIVVHPGDLPKNLIEYLSCAHSCVNPKCKGVYFDNRVEHIKFVDFCGKYRIPLLQYLCSPNCSESANDEEDNDSDEMLKKVLLG